MSLIRRGMRPPRNLASPPGLVDDVLQTIRDGMGNERLVADARSGKDARDIHRKLEAIMHTLDEVLDSVTAQRTAIDSLSALTSGLKKQIDDALGGQLTPSQQMRLDAIFNKVEENKSAIVDAINANDGDSNTPPVSLIPTQTILTSSNSRVNVGEPITLSAGVLGRPNPFGPLAVPALTGSVVFRNDIDVIGSASLDSTGVGAIASADFAGGPLTEGEHSLSASYSGDSVYAPSDSDVLVQTVVSPIPVSATAGAFDPANPGNTPGSVGTGSADHLA